MSRWVILMILALVALACALPPPPNTHMFHRRSANCVMCKVIVNSGRDAYRHGGNSAAVMNAMKNKCKSEPSGYDTVCKKLTKTSPGQMYSYIQQYDDQSVCAIYNFC